MSQGNWAAEALGRIEAKLAAEEARHPGEIPALARDGVYDNRLAKDREWNTDDGPAWWTNGFWGGLFHLMGAWTGKDEWILKGRGSMLSLDCCFIENYMGLHHDVGFMWLPLAVADYKLTGWEGARRRGLLAAQLLAGRFNPAGFIRAWNDPGPGLPSTRGWAIIDCMLNISILRWASEETGDPRYAKIADIHAATVMENFIREDGSVRHIVEFDPETGEFAKEYGGQGMAEGSAWTRGQSWGLYGFLNSHVHTGKPEHLAACEKIAAYIMPRVPSSGLMPVDFLQPDDVDYEDSTASAVMASAFVELAGVTGKKEYAEMGELLARTLVEKRCDFNPGTDGIVQRCSGSYHGTGDRDVSFVYADYYLAEALMKIAGKPFKVW